MEACRYCDETFADEDAYLDHLEAAHPSELSRIDERRVAQRRSASEREIPQVAYHAGAAVVILLLLAGVYLALSGVSSNERIHEHGELILEIDGERYHFEDHQQHREPDRFHFHPNDALWHMHPDRLTVEEAMDELGAPVTETSISVGGTTYDDEDPNVSVTMTLNGESLDLDEDLEEGDRIEIIVETEQ